MYTVSSYISAGYAVETTYKMRVMTAGRHCFSRSSPVKKNVFIIFPLGVALVKILIVLLLYYLLQLKKTKLCVVRLQMSRAVFQKSPF